MKGKLILLFASALIMSFCGCTNSAEVGERVEKTLLEKNAVTVVSFQGDYLYRAIFLSDGTCYNAFSNEEIKCPVLNKPAGSVVSVAIYFDKYLDSNLEESAKREPYERCNLMAQFESNGDVNEISIYCSTAEFSINSEGISQIYLPNSSCFYTYAKNSIPVSTSKYEVDACANEDAELAIKGIGVFNKLFEELGLTKDDLFNYVKWFVEEYSTTIKEKTEDAQTIFTNLGVKVYSHFDNDDCYYSMDNRIVDSEGEALWGVIPEEVSQANVVIMLDANNKITLGTNRTIDFIYDDGYSYSESTYLKYTTTGAKGEYYYSFDEEKEYVRMNSGCYYDIAGTVQNEKQCSNNDEAKVIVESYKLWQKEIGMDSFGFIVFGMEFMNDYTNPLMQLINS